MRNQLPLPKHERTFTRNAHDLRDARVQADAHKWFFVRLLTHVVSFALGAGGALLVERLM